MSTPPIAITSAEEAAEQFGAGSLTHRFALRIWPPPPPPPEQVEAMARALSVVVAEQERARIGWAFLYVGQCIDLVEVHAQALFDSDVQTTTRDVRHIDHWREVAHRSLALIYERTPELLPIGPDVHADCHSEGY